MHGPERRDGVLRAVKQVFEEVDGDHIGDDGRHQTETRRREHQQAAAERAHHRRGRPQNER
jgi:hypothetical protein